MVASVVLAAPAGATLAPEDLRAAEEARRLAVTGDLDAARRRWEEVLARTGPAHAVRVATPCAGLREALVARRDLAPLFVRTLPDGCHEVLWGHFATEDAALQASGRVPQRWLDGPADVVALAAPLLVVGAPAAGGAATAAPQSESLPVVAVAPEPVATDVAPPPTTPVPLPGALPESAPMVPAQASAGPAETIPAEPASAPEAQPTAAAEPPPTVATARDPTPMPTPAPAPTPTAAAGPPPTPAREPTPTPAAEPPAPAREPTPTPAAAPPTPAREPEREPDPAVAATTAPEPPATPKPPAPPSAPAAAPAPGESAASLFQKGNAAYAAGDLDAAIAAFEGALALEPDNPRSMNNLGAAWLLKGDIDRAVALARRALELDPGYARAELNLGTALFAQDRLDEAQPHLERAVEMDPQNLDAWHNLAALLARQRRWTEAERVLLGAQERAPSDERLATQLAEVRTHLAVRTATPAPQERPPAAPPVRSASAPAAAGGTGGPCSKPLSPAAKSRLTAQLLTDGREAYQRKDHEAAEVILERALECDPTSAAVLNHLGAARLQGGKAGAAISAFTLALQFQPDFLEASVNLALAQLADGRCDDATSRLGGLRSQHADSGEVAYQHARALARCGRSADALAALEAAERLLPADERVSRLRERLSRGEP